MKKLLFIKFIGLSLLLLTLPLTTLANPLKWKGDPNLFETISSILKENHILPNGDVGITAINLKTGQAFSINGDQPFFMASTYKVAIATQFLTLVDKKLASLDKIETITPHDIVPGSGILIKYFKDTTITLSADALLTLMLQESDNTATDRILELAGGPIAVTERLRQLGITDMSVNRSTLEFTRDYFNVKLPAYKDRNFHSLMALYSQAKPNANFLNDKRDSSTSNAMTTLLAEIYQHKALSDASTKHLLHLMSNLDGNTGRLFYYLPNAILAQKLGTGEGVVNDVGLIQLPNNGGTIAIAIFLKNISDKEVVANKVPALIAKTIYDFFLFNTNKV